MDGYYRDGLDTGVHGPLVSCIVPVFNGEHHLADALDSVLRQTYGPIELLVVDDGSTDGTSAIIEAYAGRVQPVRQENGGPASARNLGVCLARGAFVSFLDQDDWWHPEKLERQMARFAVRPDLDACVAHVENVWWENTDRRPDQPRSGVVPGYITGTLLARRSAFTRVGPFDVGLRFVDSLDWFIRAAECGLVVELLPDVLLHHRVHGDNLSRRGLESRAECLRVLKRSLDRQKVGHPERPR